MSLSLEGRVAIVTGAAHGLGRCHAVNLAKQGARVVVNDIGADDVGGGRNESPAQQVVDEIKAAGGEAVAHFGDVADWNDAQALVQRAIDTYGDLDILINNAGFTRDATIFNMTEQDFDDVVRVHLKGHFAVSKFAMIHWRNQSKQAGEPAFGRLISTASESWLFGTPGQPNYAPAKAGIVALTMGLAQMGLRYGVTANVIMPRARTRMTLKGPMGGMFEKPDDGFDNFDPENSSPLFVYLCTPEAGHISGELFLIWGRATSVWKRPEPYAVYETEDIWTVERLHEVYGPHFESRQTVTDGFTVPAM